MEREFNNDFEQMLKQQADQYRMYPSERVWKGIYRSLHPARRWFGLGAVLLLISSAFVTLIMIDSPGTQQARNGESNSPAPSAVPETGFSINDPASVNHASVIPGYNAPAKDISGSTDANVPVSRLSPQIPFASLTPEYRNDSEASEVAENFTMQPESLNLELTDQDSYRMGHDRNTKNSSLDPAASKQRNLLPLTIESVQNIFSGKRRKLSWQAYFTPTVSYRSLSENKAFIRSAAANNPGNTTDYTALYDIDKAVTHKPAIGLELGVAARYHLNDKFRLRAGVQFNMSRYDIRAFQNPTELATIALDNGGFAPDDYNTTSSYRNFSGGDPQWLNNMYFQVSLPVGAEIILAGNKDVKFGIGGTMQPTYVLGDRAYLLTTDYKNYAEVPWLMRKWNLNTNFETFVSYSTGKLDWQVGPQVRYQVFSSYLKKYPVRENLFDFGLKVGISLSETQD